MFEIDPLNVITKRWKPMLIATFVMSILVATVTSLQPKLYQTTAVIRAPSLTEMVNLQQLLSTEDFLNNFASNSNVKDRIDIHSLRRTITVIPAGETNLRIVVQGHNQDMISSLANEYVDEAIRQGNQKIYQSRKAELERQLQETLGIRDQLVQDLKNPWGSALLPTIGNVDISIARLRYQLAYLQVAAGEGKDPAFLQVTVRPADPQPLRTRDPVFTAAATAGATLVIATLAALYLESRRFHR